jgi:hypothetical protein
MTRARAATASLLFFVSAVTAATVELEDVLQALLDQALTVKITARVTENGEEAIQSYDLTRVTISGRAVRLRLEGGNLTIIAEFTPFEDDEGILLVAEGRILLRAKGSEEVQYHTSLRSMPLSLGESVVFYPLGKSTFDMDLESQQSGELNVELEVEVRPYEGEQG